MLLNNNINLEQLYSINNNNHKEVKNRSDGENMDNNEDESIEDMDVDYCDNKDNYYQNIEYHNNNILIWSQKLSSMTGGYLPGDIENIIRRATGKNYCIIFIT